jgi:DNA (cytosine-5)-methyltransferase 1
LENEILEDAGLEVFGETDWSNDDKDDLLPLRVLTDFAIYRQSKMELVYPLELANVELQRGVYSASGIVRPWSHESDGDSESDASLDDYPQATQRVRLSSILEFNIHDHDFREWRLDEYVLIRNLKFVSTLPSRLVRKIYVRTQFAWYILEIPCRQYDCVYAPFWIQHQMFHLILSAAMRNPDITYDEFVKSLVDVSQNQDSSPLAMEIIGRHVNETDFLEDDVVALCFLSITT